MNKIVATFVAILFWLVAGFVIISLWSTLYSVVSTVFGFVKSVFAWVWSLFSGMFKSKT